MATGTIGFSREKGTTSVNSNNVTSIPSLYDIRLTGEQEEYLERQFGRTKNPHPSELILIAAETGVPEDEVKIWFERRMAMWRRDQGLSPYKSRIC